MRKRIKIFLCGGLSGWDTPGYISNGDRRIKVRR